MQFMLLTVCPSKGKSLPQHVGGSRLLLQEHPQNFRSGLCIGSYLPYRPQEWEHSSTGVGARGSLVHYLPLLSAPRAPQMPSFVHAGADWGAFPGQHSYSSWHPALYCTVHWLLRHRLPYQHVAQQRAQDRGAKINISEHMPL